MAEFKLTPAHLAMNRLGDAWKLNLENRDKPMTLFANAFRAWDDFTAWLEGDLKQRHPDKFDVIYEKTLPTFIVFQQWFYWQRNRLVSIDAVDKVEAGIAQRRRMTSRSSAEIVQELDRLDHEEMRK
jgi:hypothetical protein